MSKYTTKGIALASAAFAACLASEAAAQNATYTEIQATQGGAMYGADCARCHGAQLQGAEGPALKGGQFDGIWRGGPVKDLFAFIKEFMPADKAGSLKDGDAVILTAFILKENGVPAGAQPLVPNPPGNIPAK